MEWLCWQTTSLFLSDVHVCKKRHYYISMNYNCLAPFWPSGSTAQVRIAVVFVSWCLSTFLEVFTCSRSVHLNQNPKEGRNRISVYHSVTLLNLLNLSWIPTTSRHWLERRPILKIKKKIAPPKRVTVQTGKTNHFYLQFCFVIKLAQSSREVVQ